MLIIAWVLALVVTAVIYQRALYQKPRASFSAMAVGTKIIIPRGGDGHYYLHGTINSIPVIMLLDSGATKVAIPSRIAQSARIQQQYTINTHTASGYATGFGTTIDSLKFGPVELTNIQAIIIPDMPGEQILLGMNVLQHFDIILKDNTMTLTLPE